MKREDADENGDDEGGWDGDGGENGVWAGYGDIDHNGNWWRWRWKLRLNWNRNWWYISR